MGAPLAERPSRNSGGQSQPGTGLSHVLARPGQGGDQVDGFQGVDPAGNISAPGKDAERVVGHTVTVAVRGNVNSPVPPSGGIEVGLPYGELVVRVP